MPVIITTRKDSWRYLGFKHVNGPATWGSYAKAQYIAHVHNEYGIPLDEIALQTGDYNSTILRMYRGLMIVEQAEEANVFKRSDIAKNSFHFNYIYTRMDYPGIGPVAVTIGGRDAQVLFAGLAPGFAGLYQVNAIVPGGVAPGTGVDLTVTVSGQTSQTVTIGVR